MRSHDPGRTAHTGDALVSERVDWSAYICNQQRTLEVVVAAEAPVLVMWE
jgi:hypothetical protein